jgi:hypothetical protein
MREHHKMIRGSVGLLFSNVAGYATLKNLPRLTVSPFI